MAEASVHQFWELWNSSGNTCFPGRALPDGGTGRSKVWVCGGGSIGCDMDLSGDKETKPELKNMGMEDQDGLVHVRTKCGEKPKVQL